MAGPHAVATADGPGDDSVPGTGSAAADSAPSRAGRPAATDRSGRRAVPAPVAVHDVDPAPIPDGVPDEAVPTSRAGVGRAAVGRSPAKQAGPQSHSDSRGADEAVPRPLPPAAVVQPPREQDPPQPSPVLRAAVTRGVPVAPAAAIAVTTPAPAPGAASASSAAAAGANGCPACWGADAANLGQKITTIVNHLFNSTFDLLSTLPGGPFTNLLEGTLVLVRRSLFLIPTGVTATQSNTELMVKVNTGSVAYVRQNGDVIEVSGLPSFRPSDRFDDVEDVMVSNPGNAGCAGFVLESGQVAANLQTNQIDSMRFGPDAAFTGTVNATVTGGGALRLQDAVRGLKGVDIDAPVVLKNDVAIDGGSGACGPGNQDCDVTFHQTVDAARAGEQSLTVTALGTTTFGAAVGSQAALASLLTRGIAPLQIDQSADTKSVPLHYLPYVSMDNQGKIVVQVKYGIDVAMGDNPSQMYEFDTGGNSFFAGYNPTFWTNVPLTTDAITVTFSSGNTFSSVVANGKVTIGTGAQTVSTAEPIRVGAILAGTNPDKGETFVFTDPDAPPIEGSFFGDFGASFDVFNIRETGQLMASPLLQLPGNLHTGFLVQLGPIGTTNPQLTVGITDALRAQFPYGVPVSEASPPQTYPVSGYPVLNLFGISPTYYADGPDGKLPIGCDNATSCPPIQTVIDSGAPSTSLRVTEGTPYEVDYDPTTGKGQLQTGADLIAEFPTIQGRDPLTWVLTAGVNPSVDSVSYGGSSAATSGENVNTGLNFYNNFDVMFDAQQQVIWLRPNDGYANVVAGSVTTTGDQTFRQSAQLGGVYTTGGGSFTVGGVAELADDVVIDAGGGDVSFYGTVDATTPPESAQSLTVNSTGTTTFTRAVGGLDPLNTFSTDSGGRTVSAGVTTVGNQTFGDPVTLSGGYTVTAKGTFTAAEDATLAGPVSIANEAKGQGITFGGRIEGSPTRGYQLALSTDRGTVDFKGDVGANNSLGGLEVSGAGTTFTSSGAIHLNGDLGNAPTVGLSIKPEVTVNLVQGGVVQGFTDSGVVVGNAVSGVIQGFVISNNGKNGIETHSTSGLGLVGNVLTGNTSNGLSASGDEDLGVVSNTLAANGNGIKIDGTTGVLITQNQIPNNTGTGIMVTKARDTTILANTITGSGGDGITLDQSKKTAITDNLITGNVTGILAREKNGAGPTDTDNTIAGNVVSGNSSVGVVVDSNSIGNAILANSIFSNGTPSSARAGIRLQTGGNAEQPAPQNVSAIAAGSSLSVTGTVKPYDGYAGTYTLQVFLSPSTDEPAQGRTLVKSEANVAAGDFQFTVDGISGQVVGSFITVTATPSTGPANTSEFSIPVVITT